MSIIRVNANLFRLAQMTVSTEKTRYCLNGIFVTPHAVKGVMLVSTDGHRMTVIHDEAGRADQAAIIRISPEALKLCKMQKQGARTLEIQVEPNGTGNASIYDNFGDEKHLQGISPGNCMVDGTFPDWRRVLPNVDFDKPVNPGFNGNYLADFGKLGAELAMHFNGSRPKLGTCMAVMSSDVGGPALIRWSGIEAAFGVLMPVRRGADACFPAFLNAKPAIAQDAT